MDFCAIWIAGINLSLYAYSVLSRLPKVFFSAKSVLNLNGMLLGEGCYRSRCVHVAKCHPFRLGDFTMGNMLGSKHLQTPRKTGKTTAMGGDTESEHSL